MGPCYGLAFLEISKLVVAISSEGIVVMNQTGMVVAGCCNESSRHSLL